MTTPDARTTQAVQNALQKALKQALEQALEQALWETLHQKETTASSSSGAACIRLQLQDAA